MREEMDSRIFSHLLCSVIRICFMDSEATMEILVKAQLDQFILTLIADLRKQHDGTAVKLGLVLVSEYNCCMHHSCGKYGNSRTRRRKCCGYGECYTLMRCILVI
jgi:hypothetical protein